MNLKSALDQVDGMVQNFRERTNIIEAHRTRIDKLQAIVERHQKSIRSVQSKIVRLNAERSEVHPLLENRYLKPIADAALAGFPGMTVEIRGPFGIGMTSDITICDPSVAGPERRKFSLSFRFNLDDGTVSYVDHSQVTKRYPEGSMGEVNGLNFVAVPLNADMEVDQLIKLFTPCETLCAA